MSSSKSPHQYHFFDKNTALNDRIFGASRAARVKQTHSSKCVSIDQPFAADEWIEADAIVTRTPNVPIGVITADCAPVLLVANGVVGAAHAGWQGAVNGVLENTVAAMKCDPITIQACIGPCISKQSYEVSKGFEKPFVDRHAESTKFFTVKSEEKLLFDLRAYCAFRLGLCGVQNVEISDIDTLTNESYHSHRGGAGVGDRNLSAIMING